MIPKKLHFIWIGGDLGAHGNRIDSWRNRHPNWEIVLWDNARFLARTWRLSRQMKEIGQRDVRGIVELMRIEILHDEGGIAVDIDSFCLRPIPPEMLQAEAFSCWVDEIQQPGVLSTSFMGARPKCPTLGKLLAQIGASTKPLALPIEESVGNRRLSRVWRDEKFAGLTVYPSARFLSGDRAVAGERFEGSVIGLHERTTMRALGRSAPGGLPQEVEAIAAAPAGDRDCAVSVVIPCYGQAQYLSLAVASVVAQTYANWEIVVVNDGSPDDTSAIVAGFAALYPDRRIRLIEQENAGLSNARNAGLRVARGRYLLPLDADDALDPTFLARTVEILEREPGVSIVHTDVAIFGARRGIWSTARPFDVTNLANENGLAYASLYRREVWEKVGGYRANMTAGYEDWDFWLSAAAAGLRAQHVPEALMLYREKSGASMLVEARRHDAALRARLMLNHPQLYPGEQLEGATRTLAASPLPAVKPARLAREITLHGERDLRAA